MIEKWNLSMEERKIWIALGGSVLFSFLLAILVILFDTRILAGVEYLPKWTLTSVDLARQILGLLAGSLFSVATFTFATMLSIITLYTSNFSPRAIENFLLNPTSMQTLGIFLGGFIYCLASLFFMRSSEDEYVVISATIALIYALGAVFTFTRFVYTSSQYVQLEKLIHSLYEEAQEVYDNYIKRFEDFPSIKHLPDMSFMYTFDIVAAKSAYVEHIDFDTLKKIADEKEANIIVTIRVGYFVTQDEPIMEIKTNKNIEDELDDITKRVNQSLSFETEKSAMYDPDYARIKLTEVALRAVSPGINDPNTAIHVLHYKSLLEKRLAGMPGKYVIFINEDEKTAENTKDTIEKESKNNENKKKYHSSKGDKEDPKKEADEKGIDPQTDESSEEQEENKEIKTEIISSDENDKEKQDEEKDKANEKRKRVISGLKEDENNKTYEASLEDNKDTENKSKSKTTNENKYTRSVFYRYNDFAEDLHSGYWQLVFYMQKDISGVHALFDALKTISYASHLDNLGFIKEYNEYLYNMTSKNFQETFDQNIIERDYEAVKTIIEKKKAQLSE
ncbi:MAG: DUF2254 family protein [Alkalibacterium gilvum]|uniref:Uncharacterized membrane protein n=2 Tax=Alkalibacterium TaxID=99906 RepID=A0A1H6RT71_9LACT|nr:DUF2254 domain-containing protein [Alkalibacterium gilvum]SEI55737.1 Uncharacterized membrane protein [Alkalibacterium gilvum]